MPQFKKNILNCPGIQPIEGIILFYRNATMYYMLFIYLFLF